MPLAARETAVHGVNDRSRTFGSVVGAELALLRGCNIVRDRTLSIGRMANVDDYRSYTAPAVKPAAIVLPKVVILPMNQGLKLVSGVLVILRLSSVVLLRTLRLCGSTIEICCFNGNGVRYLGEISEQERELVISRAAQERSR